MLGASAAKAAPIALPPAAVALTFLGIDGHFLLKVIAVVTGIALGALWRAGMLRNEGKDWGTVRGDLAVSALIGGGNATMSMGVAEVFGLGALLAMATGVIVGATGIRAVPAFRQFAVATLQRWALGNNVGLVEPNNEGLNRLLDELTKRDDEGHRHESDGTNEMD